MRTVELLTILGSFVGALVAGLASLELSIIKKLKKVSATSEKNAIELLNLRPISKLLIQHLKKSDVIIKTKSGSYYYDESKYSNLRKKRIVVTIIFLVLTIFLIINFH